MLQPTRTLTGAFLRVQCRVMLELLNQRKETEMQTWAMWTFGLIAFSAVTKALVIGFADYPRTHGRGTDAIDLVIAFAWLVWGACAIW